MFLTMLAQLDDLGLLGDATEVKSLGCTMAMYIKLAVDMRESNALSDAPRKKYSGSKALQPDYFEDAILSYANKRGVMLCGPDNIDELVAEAVGEVELPKKNAKDPWRWEAEFKKYKKANRDQHGVSMVGGDRLDITTFSSAERKAASFKKKDPLGKKEMDAIKNGLILQFL
jgi:hypothetical protein